MTYPNQPSYPTMPPGTPGPPRSQWTSPAVMLAVIAGLLVLIGGVIAAFYFAGGHSSKDQATPPESSIQQPVPPDSGTPQPPVTVTSVVSPSSTQPSRPASTPTVSGADRQGFIGISGARCNADDDAVFVGYTSRSHIVVCQVGSDTSRLYYKGWSGAGGITIDYPSRAGDTFTAVNGSTQYVVSPSQLTIYLPDRGPQQESMISAWVN